jgi:hypothetical protein
VLHQDFDSVVLGIAVGAHRHICADLMEASPPFREMVEGIATCRTQAMQLWFAQSLPELGWEGPSPVLGAFAEPYDTWADMTHLLAKESWEDHSPGAPPCREGRGKPRNLAYFCGYLDDSTLEPKTTDATFQGRENARAKRQARAWLADYAAHLWPRAAGYQAEPLNPEFLFDPAEGVAGARFDAQYVRANVNPSDRYVLSVPGSTKYRLRANQSGFTNLYLAGDWLLTGLNGGCIEAAVMGGLQACKAIWHDLDFKLTLDRPIIGGIEIDVERGRVTPRSVPRELPAYVERGGGIVLQHPYLQRGTRLVAWLFRSRYEALVELCDRYLNLDGELAYRPLAPFVALISADIQRAGSESAADRAKGWMPERDVSFWVPVVAGRRLGGVWLPAEPRLSWFLPYVWVDSGIAMAAGREVFGFPKEAGRLEISELDPNCLSVSADVTRSHGLNHPVTFEPLVSVERVSRVPSSNSGVAPLDARSIRSTLIASACLEGAPPSMELLHQAILTAFDWSAVPLTFLKQFRDVADPRRACYRAIVEACARPTAMRAGAVLSPQDYRIHVHSYASHPLAIELGLGIEPTLTLTPLAGFWLDFDFVMDRGRVVTES